MFLSLCHYPTEKLPFPLHLKGLSLKKNDSVIAPTHFAQALKFPSSNTGAFPSGRDADNQPSLKTAIGYTDM